MIAAPGIYAPAELRLRLADLYCAYGDALDDGDFEAWPDFFTADCLYQVIPRDNFDRGLPLALLGCESRDMLADRVVAIREALLYAPRLIRRLTSNIRLRAIAADGWRLTANFALFETMVDQPTHLFMCGRYHDRVVEEGGVLRFAERVCVYDATVVPISFIFPV